MLDPSRASASVLTSFILLLACGGCTDCAGKSKRASTQGPPSSLEGGPSLLAERSLPFTGPLTLLDGEMDLGNRYPSAVRVQADSQAMSKECSGVLIGERLVLTAAHCVCLPRNALAPECAATATVTAIAYLPALPDGNVRSLNEVYGGAVLPHPEFRILLDAQGQVESTHADLALILLKEPATADFPPVKLADTAVGERESLTLVGYGDDELSGGGGEGRRFSKHQVMKLPKVGGDLIVLAPPARPAHQDDNGGPCLNEAGRTPLLAGISRRGLGSEATCTSTLIHEAWLHEGLRRASRPHSSNP